MFETHLIGYKGRNMAEDIQREIGSVEEDLANGCHKEFYN